jgi:hypothetical protein
MADWPVMWRDVLFALGGGLVLLSLLSIAAVLRKAAAAGRNERIAPRNPKTDLPNMMILLQTMRDLLREQQQLARQLNESLDKKVAYIKRTVDAALEQIDFLRNSERDIAVRLANAQADVESVQKQAGYANQVLEDGEQGNEPSGPLSNQAAVGSGKDPLDAVAPPRSAPGEESTDDWVGLDFAGDEPDPNNVEMPEIAPESPEEVAAAHQAFRALLNMDAPRRSGSQAHERGSSRNGNGQGQPSPLHGRIYDYSDAGMSVADISRELGIGKGEIRLILSLRKDKGGGP